MSSPKGHSSFTPFCRKGESILDLQRDKTASQYAWEQVSAMSVLISGHSRNTTRQHDGAPSSSALVLLSPFKWPLTDMAP